MDKAEIQKSVDKLEKYILKEQFKGYDPFDGLMSPVFRLPLLRTNKYLRLGIQQLLKRNPINMRPILGIRK